MIDRRGIPGFAAGLAGLSCTVAGLATDQPWFVAAAGLCALMAGLFTLGMGERLRHTDDRSELMAARASRLEEESDQMAARAAKFEAEALVARTSLADVREAEAANPVPASGTAAGGITDVRTGLFNEQFFEVTLDKRVCAARRGLRPLAVVLLEVATGVADGPRGPADPKAVAGGILETLRDADTACRLDDGRFAMVLEDTPENGAVWTVERVRRRLAEQGSGHTMWAGVACYPAHAFDAEHILDQAERALTAAKDWRQDRIEVAAIPED